MSFYLKFDTSIPWFIPDGKEWIIHASRRRGYFILWQNFDKIVPGSHIIQGTMTDKEVRRLEIFSGDIQIFEKALNDRLHSQISSVILGLIYKLSTFDLYNYHAIIVRQYLYKCKIYIFYLSCLHLLSYCISRQSLFYQLILTREFIGNFFE